MKDPIHRICGATIGCIAVLISACHLPLPRCERDELGVVEPISPPTCSGMPDERSVVDPAGPLVFEWTYPLSGEASCAPDFFEVAVAEHVYGYDSLGVTGRVPFDSAEAPGPWSLTWPVPLEPGTKYYYRISAGLETGPGSDEHRLGADNCFIIGPLCTREDIILDHILPVELISPADGTIIEDLSTWIIFRWDDPTGCHSVRYYESQVSTDPTFAPGTIVLTGDANEHNFWDFDLSRLEDCTRYYWHVRTSPGTVEDLRFEWLDSEVWSFFVNTPGTVCPPPPMGGPSAPPTEPPPEPRPMARALLNLNCRAGPTPRHEIDDTFFQGESAPIHGRNEDSTWLYILSPNRNIYCWVWKEQVSVEGDISDVEVVEAAPAPAEEAPVEEEPSGGGAPQSIDCSQFTDFNSCTANQKCEWKIPGGSNVGSCVNK